MHRHILVVCDHEIVCRLCAQVIEPVYENSSAIQPDNFWSGLDKMMLAISVSQKVGSKQHGFWADHFDRNIINYYRISDRLLLTVEQMGLPKYYAYETMRLLFKTNKHFWSYRGQLKTLLEVMQTANDKRLAGHIKVIQKRLNNAKGI